MRPQVSGVRHADPNDKRLSCALKVRFDRMCVGCVFRYQIYSLYSIYSNLVLPLQHFCTHLKVSARIVRRPQANENTPDNRTRTSSFWNARSRPLRSCSCFDV